MLIFIAADYSNRFAESAYGEIYTADEHHGLKCGEFVRSLVKMTLTCLRLPDAVVGRLFQVDEVGSRWFFVVSVGHDEAGGVLVHGDQRGAVVFVAEVVAHAPEVLHGQPAGPHRTRAAHAVALTAKLQ